MMFLYNLSVAVLQLCDKHNLSYEAASERCDLSSRYFGNIVRRQTAPSIRTLEKLCVGFDILPNDLLVSPVLQGERSYREPMRVNEICCFHGENQHVAYPVCPRCRNTLEREYQSFCDRCGQALNWSGFLDAKIIWLPK